MRKKKSGEKHERTGLEEHEGWRRGVKRMRTGGMGKGHGEGEVQKGHEEQRAQRQGDDKY